MKRLKPCWTRGVADPPALRDEALLGGLLGDAHAPADLGPRRARAPGLVDEVTDEVVGELAQVIGREDGVAELLEDPEMDPLIASIRSSRRTGLAIGRGVVMSSTLG